MPRNCWLSIGVYFIITTQIKSEWRKGVLFFPIILGVLLNGCIQTNYPFTETQITFSPYNHSLDNNDNFSPDNMWLVYDTRTNNGGIRRGKTIEKVNLALYLWLFKKVYDTAFVREQNPYYGLQ